MIRGDTAVGVGGARGIGPVRDGRRRAAARPTGAVLLSGAVLGACAEAPPPGGRDLEVRIEIPRAEVGVGEAFPLAVVRAWDRELEPSAFAADSLAPLRVRAVGAERRAEGRRVVETLRFTAAATSVGEVRVAAPRIEARPRGGGAVRAAAGGAVGIRAVGRLDPLRAGTAEFPAAMPVAGRRPWGGIAAVAAAAAFAAAWLLRGRMRRAGGRGEGEATDDEAPQEPLASGTLRALRALEASGAGAVDDPEFHDALIRIVRAELAARGAAGDTATAAAAATATATATATTTAAALTTEELLASAAVAASLGSAGRGELEVLLRRSDRVRFAAAAGTAADRQRMLEAASRMAEATP